MDFVSDLRRELAAGRYERALAEYCRSWRETGSDYAVGNVVSRLVEEQDAGALIATLTDPGFRRACRLRRGAAGLRRDLRAGVAFFAERKPDLLWLLRLQGLMAPAAEDRGLRHAVGRFLQLGTPPSERRDEGLHRILNEAFPRRARLTDSASGRRRRVRFLLRRYTLGHWRCRCGEVEGEQRRYEHRCPCGALAGFGPLPPGRCGHCGATAEHATCPSCGTRVTLDLLWRITTGGVHPRDLVLPVELDVGVRTSRGERSLVVHLCDLPLPLGLAEREGRIVFDPPDLIWSVPSRWHDTTQGHSGGQLLRLTEPARTSELDDLGQGLETLLSLALPATLEGPFREAAGEPLIAVGRWPPRDALAATLAYAYKKSLDRVFAVRVTDFVRDALTRSHVLTKPVSDWTELLGDTSDLVECRVAGAPELRGTMIVVSEDLTAPARLGTSSTVVRTASLKRWPWGQVDSGADELTSTPEDSAPWLLEDGIVAVGEVVPPGGILVGISRKRGEDRLDATERLLQRIFGRERQRDDVSLRHDGSSVARVVSVVVDAARELAPRLVPEAPRRVVRTGRDADLDSGILARITVSLAVDVPLVVGDRLDSPEGGEGIIVAIEPEADRARRPASSARADVLVAPDHPWSGNDGAGRGVLLRAATIAPRNVNRGSGTYQMVEDLPLPGDVSGNRAQNLTVGDTDWLWARGAKSCLRELLGPRSDCRALRRSLFEALLNGDATLAEVLGSAPRDVEPLDLAELPAGRLAFVATALRVMGIGLRLHRESPAVLEWFPVTADAIRRRSTGQLQDGTSFAWTREDPQPVAGGLHCPRLFGPPGSRDRRRRTAHLVLPIPLVNPLGRRLLWEKLSETTDLSVSVLEAILQWKMSLVTRGADFELVHPSEHGTVTDDTAHIIEGPEAIEFLIDSCGLRGTHFAHLLMRTVEVLPAGMRPMRRIGAGGLWVTSDSNDLYRKLFDRLKVHERMVRSRAPRSLLAHSQLILQKGLELLFLDGRGEDTAERVEGGGHLAGLLFQITRRFRPGGTLLDHLLEKSIDFSARTRLVAASTPAEGVALVDRSTLWTLLELAIKRRLARGGILLYNARRHFEERTKEARDAFATVVREAVVLASLPTDPPRVAAFRCREWDEPALGIDADLVNRLGWEHHGASVRLFAALTREAKAEALERLGADLSGVDGTLARARKQRLQGALAFVQQDLGEAFVRRCLKGSCQSLSGYEETALCLPPAVESHGPTRAET